MDSPIPPTRSQGLPERLLMLLLLAGIGVGCVLVLHPFLSAILWAMILVFTTWPVFTWLRVRLRIGARVAAGLMVLIVAVVIVLPIALTAPAGADDVNQLRHSIEAALSDGLSNAPDWVRGVPLIGVAAAEYWDTWAADLSVAVTFFRPYFGMIAEQGLNVLLGVAGGVAQFVVALMVAFFIWSGGDALAISLRRILNRIAGDQADRLIALTGATVRGTVYGILGTAIVQGLLTSFGLWLAGVPRPLLLGGIAGLLSVLPIGAPVIWIPAALWLLGTGHTVAGIFLALYGGIAISGADTIIRPYFIARGAQLPFLLTILGVLGGALAFGLLGIFMGPVLLGVGFTLAREFEGARVDAMVPPEPLVPPKSLGRPVD